jgi:hypothetical protein
VAKDKPTEMDPILRGLPDESALIASCGGVSLGRMTASSDKVVELGVFDDDPIIVILVERVFLEVFLNESRLRGSFRSFLYRVSQRIWGDDFV